MTETTIKVRQDIPRDLANHLLFELDSGADLPRPAGLIELRLHVDRDGEVVLATATSWQRVRVIAALDVEAAWPQADAAAPPRGAPVPVCETAPVSIYPPRSLRARLAAKRALERTG